MSFPVPVTSTADFQNITGTAVTFDTVMAAGEYWVFTPSVACYIKQGAAPTASAADGSTLVAAGETVMLDGALGAKLSAIQVSSSGTGTLTRAKFVK